MNDIFKKFSKARVAVVGDVMLDSYVFGNSERRSPEAPVLILRQQDEVFKLGGAANVAQNISALGGHVDLFAYVGKDEARKVLNAHLHNTGIRTHFFNVLETTTQKIRFMGDTQHQMLRLDKEEYAAASSQVEEELARRVSASKPDIIIASDYGKGVLSQSLFLKLRGYNPHTRIIVDPKPKNKNNYTGVYLITPNIHEARQMLNGELVQDNIVDMGENLQRVLDCNVLITRGEEGMSLFEGRNQVHIPTVAKTVYDITGAGDTVIAVTGLGLAAGLSLEESAKLSNYAAGIVVGKLGTAVVSRSELEAKLKENQ